MRLHIDDEIIIRRSKMQKSIEADVDYYLEHLRVRILRQVAVGDAGRVL